MANHILKRWSILSLLILLLNLTQVGILIASSVGTLSILAVEVSSYPIINLYVAVEDPEGNPLTDLSASDFSLFEEGIEVKNLTIESVMMPLLLGVIIDSASSFEHKEGGARRVDHAKRAATDLIAPESGRLGINDRVSIFAFENGTPRQLVDFTQDHNLAIDQGVAKVETTGNQKTALFDITQRAIDAMERIPGTMRRVLLIFSDGRDYVSATRFDQLVQQAQESNITIFTIGLGTNLGLDQEQSVHLRKLADGTGGRYMWYQPGRPGEEEELTAFLDHLVSHRNVYVIRYETNQYKGNPSIKVVVRKGGKVAEAYASFSPPPLPPLLEIENLKEGDIIQGIFTVRPAIFRNQREIVRLEYRVNDELVYTALSAPFTFEWDTTKWAVDPNSPTVVSLAVTAFDVGGYSAEKRIFVGVVLPPPTSFPEKTLSVSTSPLFILPLISLLVSLGLLIFFIIVVQRGGWSAVRGWAEEAARRTRIWAKETRRRITGQSLAEEAPLGMLIVESEIMQGKSFPISEISVFLGREELQADIVFDWDDFISRKHAKISYQSGQFYIWDLGSSNGTWVNEQRVPRSRSGGTDLSEAMVLKDGDIIRLGPNLRLRFRTSLGASLSPIEEPPTHKVLPTPDSEFPGPVPTPEPLAGPEAETVKLPKKPKPRGGN
ncbi:MAG: FHA domain-containing protein [Candidatus Bathyarchaeia archaeon]